jgi:hypothetical protein
LRGKVRVLNSDWSIGSTEADLFPFRMIATRILFLGGGFGRLRYCFDLSLLEIGFKVLRLDLLSSEDLVNNGALGVNDRVLHWVYHGPSMTSL